LTDDLCCVQTDNLTREERIQLTRSKKIVDRKTKKKSFVERFYLRLAEW